MGYIPGGDPALYSPNQSFEASATNLGLTAKPGQQRANMLLAAMSTQNSELLGAVIRSQDSSKKIIDIGDYNRFQLGEEGERELKLAGFGTDVIKAIKENLPKSFAAFKITDGTQWDGQMGIAAFASDAKQEWWKREYTNDIINSQLYSDGRETSQGNLGLSVGPNGVAQTPGIFKVEGQNDQYNVRQANVYDLKYDWLNGPVIKAAYTGVGNKLNNAVDTNGDGKISLDEVQSISLSRDITVPVNQFKYERVDTRSNRAIYTGDEQKQYTTETLNLDQIYQNIINGPTDRAFGKQGLQAGYTQSNPEIYNKLYQEASDKLGYTAIETGDNKDQYINNPDYQSQKRQDIEKYINAYQPVDNYALGSRIGGVSIDNNAPGRAGPVDQSAQYFVGPKLSQAYLIPGFAIYNNDAMQTGRMYDPFRDYIGENSGDPVRSKQLFDNFKKEYKIDPNYTYAQLTNTQKNTFYDYWGKQPDNPNNTFGGLLFADNASMEALSNKPQGVQFSRGSVNSFTGAARGAKMDAGDTLTTNPFTGARIDVGTDQANKVLGIDTTKLGTDKKDK